MTEVRISISNVWNPFFLYKINCIFMFFKSRFFSENRPKYPFRGKCLHFGGHDENGQNEFSISV